MSDILLSTSYRSMMADAPRSDQIQDVVSRAISVPAELHHTEFLEYSKEAYEKKSKGTKKKRASKEKLEDEDAETRRKIHIKSEQRRRAHIKNGFDELRINLPNNNQKTSKAALLTKTIQQLQHLKNIQNELLCEVERLSKENESLKKFQHDVLQRRQPFNYL